MWRRKIEVLPATQMMNDPPVPVEVRYEGERDPKECLHDDIEYWWKGRYNPELGTLARCFDCGARTSSGIFGRLRRGCSDD